MSRRFLRTSALTAAIAALLAGALPLTAPAATAAETSSAVTVSVPESWYGVEGGYFTVSKTRNLTNEEAVTVSGLVPDNAAWGNRNGVLQTATAYSGYTNDLTDTPTVPAVQRDASALPDGWSVAAHADATVTVQRSFVTGPANNANSSPAGQAVDCRVEQCFIAITKGVFPGGSGTNFSDQPAIWVPIAFEGGNAELLRDVAPAITAQPGDATVVPGASVTYRTTVTGQPAATYQWQTSVNDGTTWTDVAGATAAELTVTAPATDTGRLYRAVATNRQGTATTRAAALTVETAVTEPGTDDGRWPLRQSGSWVRLSQYADLTDGQTITVEASYITRVNSNAKRILPFEQGANDNSDPFDIPIGYDPTGASYIESATYSQVGSLFAGTGSADYVVRSQITDRKTGATIDCLTTQCYLAVGGNAYTADSTLIFGANTYLKDQIAYVDYSNNVSNDAMNTVLIPLYFAGGTLTPHLRTAPSYTMQPANVTVEENNTATFTVATDANPAASTTWQRSTDGSQTWRTIGGATSTTYSPFATPALNGVQYRAASTNALGTTYSDVATLTVTAAPTTGGTGVVLDWIGSTELQSLTPARTPNYFSAGSSDGTRATYQNVDGDARIVLRNPDGSEVLTTYDTRRAHVDGGGQQVARLSNGVADLDAAGTGTISWDASWTVNFYGGLVPFTIADPRLTIAEDGTGTLVADLSGYGSSMDDPGTKVPLEPVQDVVVATFSSVTLHNGTLTVVPDYSGVVFESPEDSEAVPQVRTTAGWGAWPQGFVDFHFKTGLTSYWYTSGGTADPLKAPLPFTVSGITLPAATAPAAPAAPTVTTTSGTELAVSWVKPSTGGSAITGYTVSVASGSDVRTVDVDGSTLSTTVGELALGTEYTVTVVAKNAVGSSEASAATTARTHGAPGVPAAPTLAAGEGTSLVATWPAPDSDGGSPVTGYDVTLRSGGEVVASRTVTETTATFADLVRGTAYTVEVAARNALGVSAASEASGAVTVAALVPSAPAAPVVTAGLDSLEVAWTAPAANGSAILDSTVSVTPTDGGTPVTQTVSTLSATLTGLDRGTSYEVTVTARNAVGSSAASAATTARTLIEAPSTLSAPTVTAVSGTELHVAWTAPEDDGGADITEYTLQVSHGSTVVDTVTVAGDVTSTTIGGLTRGTAYTVTVTADNGTDEVTSDASAVVRTLDVAAAPVVTASLAGAAGVTATWSAPADGGSAITEYVVTFRNGDAVVDTRVVPAGTESVTAEGLTPGAQVTASVVARNAVGDSDVGTSGVVAIPAVAPDAVATPSIARVGDESVVVRWVAPAFDGRSPVTGYVVSLLGPDGVTTLDAAADATSVTFDGLAAGSYSASVVAVNAAGSSEPSGVSGAVKLAGAKPNGSPELATDDLFTNASAGGVSATVSGATATITVPEHEGEWVAVSFHSDPVFLGWFQVENGVVTVPLPEGATGAHHLVVYGLDGAVIGYTAVDLGSVPGETPGGTGGAGTSGEGMASGSGLAATGSDVRPVWSALAVLLLLAGAAAVTIGSRRRKA